jgi:signal transduction histidine kinase
MREDVPVAEQGLSSRLWGTYNLLIYAVCAAIVEGAPLSVPGRIAASVAFAAMIPWFLLVGRPLMELDGARWEEMAVTWRGPVYVAGMIALFAVVQHENGNAWLLSFAFTPQCFAVTTFRRAMSFIVAFNMIAALFDILDDRTIQGVLTAAGLAVFATLFARVFGIWTARVVAQSRDRAALIAQLESTRAELAKANHQAGVSSERARLAAEIHDTLAQGFTSIVTLVQAAQAAVPESSPARGHLDLVLETARENLAEARALVADLSPVGLDGASLGDAVSRTARATEAETRAVVRCAIEGTKRPLPTGTEVVLLRVCQEALANVRKHAAASQVDVLLRYADDGVDLTVTDDGCGFDAGERHDGYGLRGMRERLRQTGGTLTVASVAGVGTMVRAQVSG